ncbi:MAG: hypothetical protein AMJ56_01375 [Anaerolineae bacterium SG8_19]|jgi:uncharacterized phosphosugar-binding protein|nr:MAG: hypothetical protein AMJ56_01375 [Anaerolineae bacterium SG8_19]
MSTYAEQYIDKIIEMLQRIKEEEAEPLKQAAVLLADAIENGQRIFAWGCTHSSTTMQDIFARAGGLMLINAIFAPGLEALQLKPITMASAMERLLGYAEIVLDGQPIQPGDVFIAVSVSGRNAMAIEMAKGAKERGLHVIAVTSRTYSDSVESRHPSGKKMYEYADVVLDNKAVKGDALLEAEGAPQRFCPGSGTTGPALMQSMVAATVEELISRGIEPPLFLAANVEGGDEYNARMFERYKDRIFYI